MGIKEHIKQNKPFKNEYHEAHINVLYTASWLGQQAACALKPFKISWQQFNMMRILRGLHPEPATVSILKERMIDKSSNASRLVDKLKKKNLVSREYCQEDRRRVHIMLTEEGMGLLEKCSQRMEEQMHTHMSNITKTEAGTLNSILDKLTK